MSSKHIVAWMLTAVALMATSCRTAKNGEVNLVGADYESMSSRFRMEVPVNGKKYVLKGNLKIKKDEQIQISVLVPMVRTEATRIEISGDRVMVIDRMNKYYAVGPISDLKIIFGEEADFGMLQSILTNDYSAIKYNKEKFRKIKMELSYLVLNKAKLQPALVPGNKYTEVELDKLLNILLEAVE